MLKLRYITAFLLSTAFIACEKKVATPAKTPPVVTKDTLSGNIYTIAGNGTEAYSGDNGPATKAELWNPIGVAVDGAGNIYICDAGNFRVRKVDKNGIISTFAGGKTAGYSGDGGPATSAELWTPSGITVDGLGNVYIADHGNQDIRKVNTSGIISTFAGNGYGTGNRGGYSGDEGPADSAELSLPYGLATDDTGNIYIADFGNQRIRKVNTFGIITSIAGNGFATYSGDGGPATAASLAAPWDVTLDKSGNFYIADYGNDRIRKIDTKGIITTIAGNGFGAPGDGGYSGDGGPAIEAELYNPTSVVVDASGNIYFADADNNRLRMVNSAGTISTIAGNGLSNFSGDGGLASNSQVGFVSGMAIDASSNIYFADTYFQRIRVIYK